MVQCGEDGHILVNYLLSNTSTCSSQLKGATLRTIFPQFKRFEPLNKGHGIVRQRLVDLNKVETDCINNYTPSAMGDLCSHREFIITYAYKDGMYSTLHMSQCMPSSECRWWEYARDEVVFYYRAVEI